MYGVVITLLVIACLLLILAVLIQNSRGGGLSSSIAGISNAQQLLGAVRSADLIEKITWYLAGSIVVLIILSNLFVEKGQVTTDLKMKNQIENQIIVNPTTVPNTNKFNQNPNE
jgi:preprotein translocase subunit SecG